MMSTSVSWGPDDWVKLDGICLSPLGRIQRCNGRGQVSGIRCVIPTGNGRAET